MTAGGADPRTLDALFAESDAVTLHVPLNDATRNLLDSARIDRMKQGALLINVGRGGDDTLFALSPGAVKFGSRKGRKLVDVLPVEG